MITKEEIESLGWKFNVFGLDDWFKGKTLNDKYVYDKFYPLEHWFKKGDNWLVLYYSFIAILGRTTQYMNKENNERWIPIYKGKCPDLKTLKIIEKLVLNEQV